MIVQLGYCQLSSLSRRALAQTWLATTAHVCNWWAVLRLSQDVPPPCDISCGLHTYIAVQVPTCMNEATVCNKICYLHTLDGRLGNMGNYSALWLCIVPPFGPASNAILELNISPYCPPSHAVVQKKQLFRQQCRKACKQG